MKAFPSGVFKILCHQRTINLKFTPIKTMVRVKNGTVSEKLSPEMNEVISLIEKYPPPIPWDQVKKTLHQNNDDFNKLILKGCSELKDADIMMSFCKYIIDKGESLSEINLFMIVKTLSYCSPEKILENENLLINLFNECKEFILGSKLFQSCAVEVFSYIPCCYRELIQISKNFATFKKGCLICRAFDFDDSSTAWELLEKSNSLTEYILSSFSNYCIRQALQNKFSVDMIQSFVNLCQRKGFIIYSSDIICALQPLVSVLTHCQDKYIWTVKKCTVNTQMECLNCNTVLNEVKISEDEFRILRKATFDALIPESDIFLKTSHSELNTFKNFLNTCQPYDIVLDGLNLYYRKFFGNKNTLVQHLLSNFIKQKKKKVLIIARKHFKKEKFLKALASSQIFFTENSSDDDLFVLYAAMHRGLGTYIVTSDFLVTHAAKLDGVTKILFIKWQLYHQYIIDGVFGIVLPSRHLGLSQCTDSPEMGGDSYKWHLSYEEEGFSKYHFSLKFNWVCLQAIPRKKMDEKK